MLKFRKLGSLPIIGNRPSPDSRDMETFVTDCGLGVIKTIDNTPKWGELKHVSVSRQDRYPSWNEIIEVKDNFFGDIDCMMVMPKKDDYVNIHKNCFHIWQMPESWGIQ